MEFPIKRNDCWDILDSSKLSDYLACPRKYFYSHILGWKMDVPAHDLHFGQCWHLAREHQLLHGYDEVKEAYTKFEEEYRKMYDPETDYIYRPKDPTGVLQALIKFRDDYHLDLVENEVVTIDGVKMTEISGKVPIAEDRFIHYRMDSIMRRLSDGKIFSWDHKSTTEKSIIYESWSNQFFLSIQNGTYTHCLYCMFPIKDVLGIEFCGTGFTYLKKGSANRPAGYHATLKRVPAYKTPDQMNTWLWTVNQLYSEVTHDMEILYECKESDYVLHAFRMNPGSCTAYRGCPYHSFCLAWSNPLRQCYEPPQGFKIEFWNPAEMDTRNKKDLEVPDGIR